MLHARTFPIRRRTIAQASKVMGLNVSNEGQDPPCVVIGLTCTDLSFFDGTSLCRCRNSGKVEQVTPESAALGCGEAIRKESRAKRAGGMSINAWRDSMSARAPHFYDVPYREQWVRDPHAGIYVRVF